MIDVIKKYYQAWETKDIHLLQSVIASPIYGVRTYLEDRLFTTEELLTHFQSNTISKVEILSYKTEQEITKLELNGLLNNASSILLIRV